MDPQGTGSRQLDVPASEHPSAVKTLGVVALALLLYLQLADSAIETFWSGAPMPVDPTTGITLGIGARGWGQGMTEYGRVGWKAAQGMLCVFSVFRGKPTAATGAQVANRMAGEVFCALVAGVGARGLMVGGKVGGGISWAAKIISTIFTGVKLL